MALFGRNNAFWSLLMVLVPAASVAAVNNVDDWN